MQPNAKKTRADLYPNIKNARAPGWKTTPTSTHRAPPSRTEICLKSLQDSKLILDTHWPMPFDGLRAPSYVPNGIDMSLVSVLSYPATIALLYMTWLQPSSNRALVGEQNWYLRLQDCLALIEESQDARDKPRLFNEALRCANAIVDAANKQYLNPQWERFTETAATQPQPFSADPVTPDCSVFLPILEATPTQPQFIRRDGGAGPTPYAGGLGQDMGPLAQKDHFLKPMGFSPYIANHSLPEQLDPQPHAVFQAPMPQGQPPQLLPQAQFQHQFQHSLQRQIQLLQQNPNQHQHELQRERVHPPQLPQQNQQLLPTPIHQPVQTFSLPMPGGPLPGTQPAPRESTQQPQRPPTLSHPNPAPQALQNPSVTNKRPATVAFGPPRVQGPGFQTVQQLKNRADWLFKDRLKRHGPRVTAAPFYPLPDATYVGIDGKRQPCGYAPLSPDQWKERADENKPSTDYPLWMLRHLRSILRDTHWTRNAPKEGYEGTQPHGQQLPSDFPALPGEVSYSLRLILEVLVDMREKLQVGAYWVHSYDANADLTLEACLAALPLLDELSDAQRLALANQIHKILHSLCAYRDDR